MADKKMDLIVKVDVVGAGAAIAATSVNTVGIIVTDAVVGTEATDKQYSDADGVKAVFGDSSEAYEMAQRFFAQKRHPASIYIVSVTAKTKTYIEAAVDAANLADVYHWCLSYDTPSTDGDKKTALQLIKDLNAYAAANYKEFHVEMDASSETQENAIKALFNGFTVEESVGTGTEEVTYAGLTESRTTRVAIYAHNLTAASSDHIGVDIASDRCGADPARGTWAHKELVGDSPDALTKAQLKKAIDTGYNVYTSIAKSPRIFLGTTCGPTDFIDTIIKGDWLKFRISEAVYKLLRDGGDGYGVDMDDSGIAAVGAEVTTVLDEAYKNHYIMKDYSVSLPLYADLPQVDKDNRRLSGIKATVTTMGSVHAVISIEVNVQK